MIEIDAKTKKIFFYYTPEEIKQHSKRDEEMYEFELLSGYVCPECKKVIDAYYVGTLPIETKSDSYSSHPYLPSFAGYNRYDPHYKFGHEYGGGYLIMCNHNDTLCNVQINPEQETEHTFLIEDVCNKRSPLFAFNKTEVV
jgi:hypothetical protein